MKQKYLISKSMEKNELIIKEFIEVDEHDVYSLACKEIYDIPTIEFAISNSRTELISTLRTTNLYPPGEYIEKIAEAVIDLVSSEKDQSIELFFNDQDSIKKDWKKPEDKKNIEPSGIDETTEAEIDELNELIGNDTPIINITTPIQIEEDVDQNIIKDADL